MESKFRIIFLVFVTMAQSFFALGSTNTCQVSTSEIEADFKINEFGKFSALGGLDRANVIFYTQLFAILEKNSLGTYNKNEYYCYPDDAEVRETTLTALMIGIYPVLETVRTMHPYFNITAGHDRSYAILAEIVRNFYDAMRLTCDCHNYTENYAQIKLKQNAAELGAHSLIGNMFHGLLSGSNFTADVTALMACSQESISSKIIGAFRVVFHGIETTHNCLCHGTAAGNENCLSILKAAQKESSILFKREVLEKYAAMHNLRAAIFLKEKGIIPGLFALHSIYANSDSSNSEMENNQMYHQYE